jgi:hypothetical protein
MVLLLIAAFLLNVAPTPTQATAGATSFTGTWQLNEKRSILYHGEGGGVLTFVVADKETSIAATRRRPDAEMSFVIPFDGKPHEQTTDAGRFVRTVRRERGTLIFQITFTRGFDKATMSFAERWSLSDGGRTLTVYSTFPEAAEDLKVFSRRE